MRAGSCIPSTNIYHIGKVSHDDHQARPNRRNARRYSWLHFRSDYHHTRCHWSLCPLWDWWMTKSFWKYRFAIVPRVWWQVHGNKMWLRRPSRTIRDSWKVGKYQQNMEVRNDDTMRFESMIHDQRTNHQRRMQNSQSRQLRR